MAAVEGDERVIATARQIVESLGTTKNATKDMLMILSTFDNRLSSMPDLFLNTKTREIEEQIELAEERVLKWGDSISDPSRHTLLWEDSPDETSDYLQAIDDLLRLTQSLNLGGQDEDTAELVDRAQTVLQVAMSRLEDEFRHILVRNTVPLDADRLYGSIRRVSLSLSLNDDISISQDEISRDEDSESEEEENENEGGEGDPGFVRILGSGSGIESLVIDLIRPEAIQDLKDIADRMVESNYEKECCQVYSSVRRDVLDECLLILGVDRFSIDEVQRIQWEVLDEKMRKWAQAVKIVVQVLLTGEKGLCDQIFVGLEMESIKEACFTETAKGSVMQLLNFAEAIVIGRRSSEKLFRILDMYDALADVMPDLKILFTDEAGEFICLEAEGILTRLGEAAVGTFVEFENAIQRETSRKPVQGGEIHPLTRYVMNYVKLLVAYSETLNLLLGSGNPNQFSGSSLDSLEGDNNESKYLGTMSPMAVRLSALIASLESKLEEKSKLYEDNSMQYIFLMNNILYIVQKVKDSELGVLLGDHWVRRRRGQVRQYSTSYLRASWSKVLSCLKDEGIGSGSGSSNSVSKVALKERFKNFNLGFEEIYRNQTMWKVPDLQLREELRISISEKVIPAYRFFMGRFASHLESGRNAGKYIKYTPEDLEGLLLDLFEGVPGPLNNIKRKLST